ALGFEFEPDLVDAFLFIGSELDGDPSDGLGNGAAAPGGTRTEFSLVDILVHEVGHSLGFLNFTEFGAPELSSLDLFRFAELGADNPSDAAEFASFPRALYILGASPQEQHQFDFIAREHLASNGSDFQASHFRETNFGDPNAPRVGVMEPAITAFETRFPEYFSIGDFDAFDAIGYDIVTDAPCLPDTNGDGELNPADFNAWVIAFNNQAPECDQNGDGLCSPGDFNAWVANFNAGC
ncbi:MAG: GC-type dockerin domain-anchored protein, partial [Planctomycetota bacterium]